MSAAGIFTTTCHFRDVPKADASRQATAQKENLTYQRSAGATELGFVKYLKENGRRTNPTCVVREFLVKC